MGGIKMYKLITKNGVTKKIRCPDKIQYLQKYGWEELR